MRERLAGLLTIAFILPLPASLNAQEGRFPNELHLKVERDGEGFELLRDFTFVDAQKRNWTAPAGARVNGASIPQWLWSIVGSPMRGRYREASVIHDHFTSKKSRPWAQVHEVFYRAMLANGVPETQAKIMYAAVYRFGPRWSTAWKGSCRPLSRCHDSKRTYVRIPTFTPKKSTRAMKRLISDLKSGADLERVIKTINYSVNSEMEPVAYYIYERDKIAKEGGDLRAFKKRFPKEYSKYDKVYSNDSIVITIKKRSRDR